MWRHISLRIRIYTILTTLVLITLLGGIIMVWYTYRMQNLITDIIDPNLAAFQVAEELEIALVNQKGFVSYYFLDGNPKWLERLDEYRKIFKERLNEAQIHASTQGQTEAINNIEREYINYITAKDQVIEYYKAGERDEGAKLHEKVRNYFFNVLRLSDNYKKYHVEQIRKSKDKSHAQAKKLRITAGAAVSAACILGILLASIFSFQILGPLRRLASEVGRNGRSHKSGDEVRTLSRRIHGLIEDIDHSQSELEKSQEVLLHAEKMSLVGKLAAGTAHSIRNPLTSVKMRLFSLSRSLELDEHQKDDFEVISGEINHVDTIVQNFLEFSKPPKLRKQSICPSDVIDLAIKLLQHRLESYGVTIRVNRKGKLPHIEADPEQLKEVLLNIILNACEAMKGGGSIVIHEEQDFLKALGEIAMIRLSDNGPGIPEPIQGDIFQPFFTTKEEGTGLGLSIASRIIEQHEGFLDLISKEGEGTTFVIVLPVNPVECKGVKF
ncbi:MAG: histidine kinase [Deltaproteobacteria bacterium]|nr:histidine kinase [Deltaproteobacteria bacterium]